MSISFPGISPTSGLAATSSSSGAQQSSSLTPKSAQGNSIVQQFLQYANMTPAQRMFASMLGKLGLTQDQFNAMSPADQQKVEEKIQQMVKQQVQDSSDKRSGLITDVSV
ncbi:hypothetical protein [Bradyrhizobium sp. dw_78]|uniref:hypothetical protein n=1 Tax=Bradyrhizobium sp. dw_78 TaxID=2719793 RepID=UPI001BD36D5A|nr:hypothetical protein [Bradyrhizobium sp. dw_78]